MDLHSPANACSRHRHKLMRYARVRTVMYNCVNYIIIIIVYKMYFARIYVYKFLQLYVTEVLHFAVCA